MTAKLFPGSWFGHAPITMFQWPALFTQIFHNTNNRNRCTCGNISSNITAEAVIVIRMCLGFCNGNAFLALRLCSIVNNNATSEERWENVEGRFYQMWMWTPIRASSTETASSHCVQIYLDSFLVLNYCLVLCLCESISAKTDILLLGLLRV